MNSPKEGSSSASGDDDNGVVRLPKKIGDLQKTITMAQIAKATGVSQGAISSLLNDRDYGIRVSDKTRDRVFKVCREMGYIPNDLRAVVRMYPELGDFCLLLSSQIPGGVGNPRCGRIAAGAAAAVPEASHPMTIAFYDETRDYAASSSTLPYPLTSGVASKVICYGMPNASLLQSVTKRGFPAVSLGYEVPLPGVLSILPDYAQASRLALESLAKLGHQRIGIVSGPFGTTDSRIIELNRGVRLACEELRLPLDPQSIVHGELTAEAGSAAFEEFFSRKPVPTAIFCMSDAAAAGVLAQAARSGVAVPGDLSVVGCGDDPCSQWLHPRLSSVRIPAEDLGAMGVREIDRLVHQGLAAEPERILLPVEYCARESAGPVRR